MGIKNLNSKKNNFINEKFFFREAINDRLKDYSHQEVENAKYSYEKKKLKVVKGKASSYRDKMRQKPDPKDISLLDQNQNIVNVSVFGTKIL